MNNLAFLPLDIISMWFHIGAITAFISVLSFFHIDSYVADKNKINWLFYTLGIVFGIATIVIFVYLHGISK